MNLPASSENVPTTWQRLAPWVGAILCLVVSALMLTQTFRRQRPVRIDEDRFRDFYEYFSAAKVLVNHGTAAEVLGAGKLGYIYPPLLAAVLMPLVGLGIAGAAKVWTLVNFGVLVAAVWRGAWEAGRRFLERSVRGAEWLIAGVAGVVVSDKLISEFKMEQCNSVMLLGWTVGLLDARKRPWLAGMGLGLAFNLKYVTLLAVPYLLARRLNAAVLWFVVWAAFFALVPAVWIGWGQTMELWSGAVGGLMHASGGEKVTDGGARVMSMERFGISITTSFLRLLGSWGWLVAMAVGAGVAAVMWRMYRKAGVRLGGRDSLAGTVDYKLQALEWAGLLIAMLAFSPQTNPRHLTQLMLPVIMMVGAALSLATVRARVWAWSAIGVIWVGLIFPPGDLKALDAVGDGWMNVGGTCWCLVLGWLVVLGVSLGEWGVRGRDVGERLPGVGR